MYIRVKEGETCRKLDIGGLNWRGFSDLMKSKFEGFDFKKSGLFCKPLAHLVPTLGEEFHVQNEIQFNKLRNFLENVEDPKLGLMTLQVVKSFSFITQDTIVPYKEGGRDIDHRISQKNQKRGRGKPKLPMSSTFLAQEWESNAIEPYPDDCGLSSSLVYSKEASEGAQNSRQLDSHQHQKELMSSIFTANEHSEHPVFSILQEEIDLNRELLSDDSHDSNNENSDTFTTTQDTKQHHKHKAPRKHKGSKRIQPLDERTFAELFPSLGKQQEAARMRILGLAAAN